MNFQEIKLKLDELDVDISTFCGVMESDIPGFNTYEQSDVEYDVEGLGKMSIVYQKGGYRQGEFTIIRYFKDHNVYIETEADYSIDYLETYGAKLREVDSEIVETYKKIAEHKKNKKKIK